MHRLCIAILLGWFGFIGAGMGSVYVIWEQYIASVKSQIDTDFYMFNEVDRYAPAVGAVSAALEREADKGEYYLIEKLNGQSVGQNFEKNENFWDNAAEEFFYAEVKAVGGEVKLLAKTKVFDDAVRISIAQDIGLIGGLIKNGAITYMIGISLAALTVFFVIWRKNTLFDRQLNRIAAGFEQLSCGAAASQLPEDTNIRTINRVNTAFNKTRTAINQYVGMKDFFEGCLDHEVLKELGFAQQIIETRISEDEIHDPVLDNILLSKNKLLGVFTVADFLARGEAHFMRMGLDELVLKQLRNPDSRLLTFAQNRQISIEGNLHHVNLLATTGLLESLTENLIRNAIKYSPDQGCVNVNIWREENGPAFFEVRDEGPGLEAFPDIFDFENGPNKPRAGKRHPDLNGAGVGLFIVFHIVRILKATIKFSNATDHGGLVVRVMFPNPIK